jgi:hypothetical protein
VICGGDSSAAAEIMCLKRILGSVITDLGVVEGAMIRQLPDRGQLGSQLLKSGDSANLRHSFAFSKVNKRYGDFATTMY